MKTYKLSRQFFHLQRTFFNQGDEYTSVIHFVLLILLDFLAAFDIVDHHNRLTILVEKLGL